MQGGGQEFEPPHLHKIAKWGEEKQKPQQVSSKTHIIKHKDSKQLVNEPLPTRIMEHPPAAYASNKLVTTRQL